MEINLLIFLIVIVALLLIILAFNFIIIGVIRTNVDEYYKVLNDLLGVYKSTINYFNNKFEEIYKHTEDSKIKLIENDENNYKNYINTINQSKTSIINYIKKLDDTIVNNTDNIVGKINQNTPYIVGIEMPKSFSDAFNDVLKKSSTKEKK